MRCSTTIGPWADPFSALHGRSDEADHEERALPAPVRRRHTDLWVLCPTATQALLDQVVACISDVSSWMRSNRLQLNADKTEALWCAPARQQQLVPSSPLSVCCDDIVLSKHVRNLGICINSDMSIKTHISRTVSSCFAVLRQIKSIRRSDSQPVLLSLVSSLVLSRLDYRSTVLSGISRQLLDRLQSALNAAARLIYSRRKFQHVTPLLKELHWLRVPERIKF